MLRHPLVGDARSRGLLGALELVSDKSTKKGFDAALQLPERIAKAGYEHGLIFRAFGDNILGFAPALCFTPAEFEQKREDGNLARGHANSMDYETSTGTVSFRENAWLTPDGCNEITGDQRYKVPWADIKATLKNVKMEVELGFDVATAWKEAQRCLNCDVQTVFTDKLCIECDACVDICPMDCITFTANGDEADLRTRLNAPAENKTQDLYVGAPLKTGRVMVKDEDVCLHCGLCAERCPTGAWDMQKFLLEMTHAGPACRTPRPQKKAA